MRYNVLTAALIATIALCMTGCVSSRKATKSSELRVESVESVEKVDSVVVESSDTVRETTTITIVLRQAQEPDEAPDTLKISTVTDRTTVRDRSQLRVKSEKLKVETDTVYVEKETDKTVAVAGPNTEIDEQGNIRHQPSYIRLLKWLFLTLIALTALIIVIRIFLKR